eukprot:GDKK01008832.1.p1 GENE.GDKK01008832.1~~GDKK01008832.1.p1  ORF type:complete len:371 (-),score=89.34 GDKK01008832.1:209-1282(-)
MNKQMMFSERVSLFNIVRHYLENGGFASILSTGDDDTTCTARGVVRGHAFSILDAFEVNLPTLGVKRFLLIRNPWGSGEWTGPFCDGDVNWTEDVCRKFKEEFRFHGKEVSDDGMFWITMEDVVLEFEVIECCFPASQTAKPKDKLAISDERKPKVSSCSLFTTESKKMEDFLQFGLGCVVEKNPCFLIRVPEDMEVWIGIQTVKRMAFATMMLFDTNEHLHWFMYPQKYKMELSQMENMLDPNKQSFAPWKNVALRKGKLYVAVCLPYEGINQIESFGIAVVSCQSRYCAEMCHLSGFGAESVGLGFDKESVFIPEWRMKEIKLEEERIQRESEEDEKEPDEAPKAVEVPAMCVQQ